MTHALRWLLVLVVVAGCRRPAPHVVPDEVTLDEVRSTEFVIQGIARAEILRSNGATLQLRDGVEVSIGGEQAEVLSVAPEGVHVRLRAGLPLGQHLLTVGTQEAPNALRVVASRVGDASSDEAGMVFGEAGMLDASQSDGAVPDGGTRIDAGLDAAGLDASWNGSLGPPDAAASVDATVQDGGEEYRPSGTCTGGSVGSTCECASRDTCDIVCVGRCDVVCRELSRCTVEAVDDSTLRCRPGANCMFQGNDRSTVTCDWPAFCTAEFHNDATVECGRRLTDASCCIASCNRRCSGAPDCD
ncbi:MAG: hypothetical protein AB8I08_02380 [Sandaracinaceae bacterium]